jgi:orotidine-5'-phosphate decarboxylase
VLSDKQLEAAKKVYLAWDLNTLDKAIPVLEATKGLLYNVKINSMFTQQGPVVIDQIKSYGIEGVFLDMKFYDIPGTVENHAYAATMHGIDFMTVHAHGGVPMMKKAVEGADKAAEEFSVKRPKILGISVLTSFKLEDYLATFDGVLKGRSVNENMIVDQVLNLAGLAYEAGIDGLVCSPMEVSYVKAAYPDLVTMVPGIKGPQSGIAGSTQNMDRVATPSNAVKWGADYLVIGSAIHGAKDPRQAMMDIINDIAGVL